MARSIPNSVLFALVAPLATVPVLLWPVADIKAAAPVPELSGSWARTTFALEPPLHGGQGPLRDSQRRRDDEPAYKSPLLTPQAAALSKQRYESVQNGKPYATPSSTCWPIVSPLVFRVQEMQLLQGKDHVTFVYMQDHEVRRVRLNATHPEHVSPSWTGDSVGHYEGDTLVVDTVGVKVGPVPVIDQAGSPFSEALHVVERYRLISYEDAKAASDRNVAVNGPPGTRQAASVDENYKGEGLQVEFTVTDPNVFKQSWSGSATYGKADNIWVENVCAENMHEYYFNRESSVPTADKPDF
ncbi:MAG TPA: hypothetical protein VEU06_04560 [Micropepsaceae bacterium]|nr:hypothetical protein [Micropepsaceae bacterium]